MHRLIRHAILAGAVAFIALSGSACGSTATAPDPVTETLNGILLPTASSWHVFSTSSNGEVTITLVSLSPLGNATVGVGLGVAANNSCNLQYTTELFRVGAVWTTTLGNKGSYCVAIYDTGQISQNVNYQLKITHP